MRLKATSRRVLTSPHIDTLVLVEGENFEDGLFRIIAAAGTPPEALAALDDAVHQIDGLLGRRAWLDDLMATTDREAGR